MIKQNKQKQFELVSGFKTAPNIGIIKYWGKWHEEEIIPLNDNIGITLCQDDLFTLTTIKLTTKIKESSLTINGIQEPITQRINKILKIFFDKIQYLAVRKVNEFKNTLDAEQQNTQLDTIIDFNSLKVQIKSINSFPTASGLASSSSGLSALALCLTEFIGVQQLDVRYLTRIGSGSSCRCLFGNFVYWPGVQFSNISDSSNQSIIDHESKRCLAYEIATSAWLSNQLNVMILVDQVAQQKEVSSKEGMKLTWQTSELAKDRVEKYIPIHIGLIMKAFIEQDFNAIMQIVIKDSNQFHATCLDTNPPLLYLNEFSQQIIELIHSFNNNNNETFKIGYTFDAGPHAVVFIHNETLPKFTKFISMIYELENIQMNNKMKEALIQFEESLINDDVVKTLMGRKLKSPSQIILTKMGNGPINIFK